jgi:dienelactone hydrolase
MHWNVKFGLSCAAAALVLLPVLASAEVRTKSFDYKDGDTVLEGFVAYDPAKTGKRPGILIFPQWTGLSDHERTAAKNLAELGYVAMVADVYGKGVRPAPPQAAGAEMTKYMTNRPLLRSRAKAGFDRLKAEEGVDTNEIAVIGYCFGGAGALETGRQGLDAKAIVTFHGSLSNPTPEDAKNIKGKVLVLHGADDRAVGPKEVDAFKEEMKAAGSDLTFVAYSQTVHSFTQLEAGTDNSKGSAYNARSAKRAWQAMKDFLGETFNQ